MSGWDELRAVQERLKARGIRDVKIFLSPFAAGKPASEVARDVARFFRAVLDGRYKTVDKIGDSVRRPAGVGGDLARSEGASATELRGLNSSEEAS